MGIVLGVVVLIGLTLFLLILFNKDITKDKGIVELRVSTKDILYEVVYYDNKTYLYQNGEKIGLLNTLKRIPKPHLTRPYVDKVYNIVDEREPSSDMTWKATIEEGVMFINYLKKLGYEEIMSIESPFYIDVILQKGDKKKRVLLLEGALMYSDIRKEPNVGSYIKDHIGGL